jgi:hypothetical protein
MAEKKTTVYSKLAQARVKLQETEITKSGKNQHLKFNYFELADFLPAINKINEEVGIIALFSMTAEQATLTVVDSEVDGGQIVFTSPIAQAKLQGNASAIQELGAGITYLRRYLLLIAYDICESDALDANIGKPKEPLPAAKVRSIDGLIKELGVDKVKFLGVLGVELLEELDTEGFVNAMGLLAKKRLEIEAKKHKDEEVE